MISVNYQDLFSPEHLERAVSSDSLAPCQCGRPIEELNIIDSGQGGKWALVSGNCCDECKRLAREAWNRAPPWSLADDMNGYYNICEY